MPSAIPLEAIEHVLDYLEHDEEKDYSECEEVETEEVFAHALANNDGNHIYRHIARVRDWLNGQQDADRLNGPAGPNWDDLNDDELRRLAATKRKQAEVLEEVAALCEAVAERQEAEATLAGR